MAEIGIPNLHSDVHEKDGNGNPLVWREELERSDSQHAFFDEGREDWVVIAIDGRSGCIDVRGRLHDRPDARADGVQEIHGRIIIRRADKVVTTILDGKTGSIAQTGDHDVEGETSPEERGQVAHATECTDEEAGPHGAVAFLQVRQGESAQAQLLTETMGEAEDEDACVTAKGNEPDGLAQAERCRPQECRLKKCIDADADDAQGKWPQ